MVGIRRSPEIRHMATYTIRGGQVVIVIHMTLGARHTYVGSRQRKRRKVVVERDGRPVGGIVAGGTVLREPGLHVIGILCAREILEMATDAIRGSRGEVVVDMTVSASQGGVHAGQGKACNCRVVKLGAHPGVHVVAGLARRGQL